MDGSAACWEHEADAISSCDRDCQTDRAQLLHTRLPQVGMNMPCSFWGSSGSKFHLVYFLEHPFSSVAHLDTNTVEAGAHCPEGCHEAPLLSKKWGRGLPPRHLISLCFLPFWKVKETNTYTQQSFSRKKKIKKKIFIVCGD